MSDRTSAREEREPAEGHSPWAAPSLPLAGLRVVVTRPGERGQGLAEHLTQLGAEVVEVPAIAFADPEDWRPLDAALSALDRFQWAAFTSATAVESCLRRHAVLGLDQQALGRTRLAAVGPATAEALREAGLSVHLVPRVHTGRGLLAELAPLVQGLRVLLPRGDIADPALPQSLRAAGALVEEVTVYRTIAPTDLPQRAQAALATGVDLVCFSSPSAVRNFLAATGEEGPPRGFTPLEPPLSGRPQGVRPPGAGPAGGSPMGEPLGRARPAPPPDSHEGARALWGVASHGLGRSPAVAVLGPTTAQAAREAGLRVIVEAPEGSPAGLAEAIARWRAQTLGGDHGHNA